MIIPVITGIGSGPTTLAAFDDALNDAGISNYNLIALSSVLPPNSKVEVLQDKPKLSGEWGDRLYIVKADMRVDTPNEEAWAGIGWVQDRKTGKGLFVEHQGASEKTVRRDITQSLEALMRRRRGLEFGSIHMKVAGVTCTTKPVCALVIAVYESESWNTD